MRKPVVGYEDHYEISDSGEVFRKLKNKGTFVGKKLTISTNTYGYQIVGLSVSGKAKTVTVHRLVAKAWIPNPKNLPQVNHLDCNKANNNVNNLEWCNQEENMIHARNNNRKPRRPVIGISLYDEKIIEYESVVAAGKDGFDKGAVSKCASGKISRYIHKGYKWYYKCTATSYAQSILHELG